MVITHVCEVLLNDAVVHGLIDPYVTAAVHRRVDAASTVEPTQPLSLLVSGELVGMFVWEGLSKYNYLSEYMRCS